MASPTRTLRMGSTVAVTFSRRSLRVALGLVLATLVLGLTTLSLGSLGVHPGGLVEYLSGNADPKTTFTLQRLRGPRLLAAVAVGVALGIAGALFQTVTRNPLGSPDVIGLGAGAGAGVAVATLLWLGTVPAPVGAIIGASVAITLVYLTTGVGFASPARVIVTGLGVAAMATAITQYVVAVALRDQASQLASYLVGTLASRDMHHVGVIAVALLLLVPCAAALSHALLPMDMGDDLADALGSQATRTRGLAIVLSVLLSAAAVSVAGPIAFVALSAPHIARRMTGVGGPNLTVSALTGAVIMVGSDLIVQQVAWLDGLPVGIVTAGVGGLYLGYLLVNEWRRTRT